MTNEREKGYPYHAIFGDIKPQFYQAWISCETGPWVNLWKTALSPGKPATSQHASGMHLPTRLFIAVYAELTEAQETVLTGDQGGCRVSYGALWLTLATLVSHCWNLEDRRVKHFFGYLLNALYYISQSWEVRIIFLILPMRKPKIRGSSDPPNLRGTNNTWDSNSDFSDSIVGGPSSILTLRVFLESVDKKRLYNILQIYQKDSANS